MRWALRNLVGDEWLIRTVMTLYTEANTPTQHGCKTQHSTVMTLHAVNNSVTKGYLCELVVPYVPRRVLSSAELNLLTVPRGTPGKYGSRSFAKASVNIWNSLRGEGAGWLKKGPTLESFKRNLKTSLFWQYYFLF